MQIGAQLFTTRLFTQTEEDFRETISRVAAMGYQTAQISAVGKDLKPEFMKAVCDEKNIDIVLTHTDPMRILHDTENVIRDHEIMGCKYIGLGAMPDKYRNFDWIKNFSKDFLPAARMMKDAGMMFMYHNHDFEFEKENGKYFIDYLIDGFAADEMGFTLDTYWVQTAGGDVCEWIEKLKDRIPCVHLKDRGVIQKQAYMFPVMEGNMNFKGIMNALEDSCCQYALVEQDICIGSPFDCLEKSYKNLQTLGYQ